jgi:citrate lyase subunit beta/citryl-CoA lyase
VIELPEGAAWLFCPADRPERFAKAASVADVVIIDLEDGVAHDSKAAARGQLSRSLDGLDPQRTVIRVNPVGTDDHRLDLETLDGLGFTMLMLAKAESAEQLDTLSGYTVVALCETPRGIAAAQLIAASPACAALMWGSEDLIAAIGGVSSRDASGAYRDVVRYARSQVLIAGAAENKPVLDSVFFDLADLPGLAAEAEDAAASGFSAKVCLHPRQVPIVRNAFASSPERLAWATRVLHEAASHAGVGAFALDGVMIDEPLIRQARLIISRRPTNDPT